MKSNMGIDKMSCMTVPEAAEILRISRNHAYELARQGKLPVIRLGKRLIIPRIGFDKWLEDSLPRWKS
jgi:excisionase family DNA binding protein